MKKSLSFFLAVIMLLSAFPVADADSVLSFMKTEAEAASVGKVYYGDMNENVKLEASDARLILRYSVGLETFTDRQKEIADCNGDGNITAADARIALRASVGLEQTAIYENNVLTNAEFLTLLMTSAGYGAVETVPYFKAVPATHKNFEGVQAAVDWNVLDKKAAFEPDKEATVGYALELAAKIKDVPAGAKLLDGTVDKKASLTKEIAEKISEKVSEYRLKDNNEKEFESVEIKKEVTEYSKNDAKAVDEDTFSIKNDTPKAGDIFIAETADGEVARKVTSVKKNNNGSYTVETVKPQMDEVFDDFSFRTSLSLDASEVGFVPAENVFIVNDPTQPQLHMADGKEKVILDSTFRLNSSDNPKLTPKLCVTTTSDYIKALNNEYVCQVDNGKELLENYNQLITGTSSDKKTLKTESVIKYEAGWGLEIGIKLSNFDIDFDFSDFWTDGDYEITLTTDVDMKGEFKGKFNSTKKLGHFPVKLGVADIFMDLTIDVYLYFDANGDVTLVGDGRIEQTYGNYDGKTDYLNNNTFNAKLEANIEAEAGLKIKPEVSVLGFDIAEMEIKLGIFGEAHAKATPLVEYKNVLYYYAGDFAKSPDELKSTIGICVDLSVSFPIVTLTVSAGEDAKKQIEKLKKKNPDLKIPTTHTFKICTLDKDTLLKPVTKSTHIENTDKGLTTVKECTRTDYETIAHKMAGYVVDKNTGKALSGATVQLLDSKDTVITTATTDSAGNFELKFFVLGTYKIKLIYNKIECLIDKSFSIDKNETNVGKLEYESLDYVALYAETVKELGNQATYVCEVYDLQNRKMVTKSNKYDFVSAVICPMRNKTTYPQLAVVYSAVLVMPFGYIDSYIVYIYTIADNVPVLKSKNIINGSLAGRNELSLMKDPITQLYSFARISMKNQFEWFYAYSMSRSYYTIDEIYLGEYDLVLSDAFRVNSGNKYEDYIKSKEDYRTYVKYYFGNPVWIDDGIHYGLFYMDIQTNSRIKLVIFDENDKYEIKYFDF